MRRRSDVALILIVLASTLSCGGDSTSPPDSSKNTPAEVIVTPAEDTLDWISATRQLSVSVLNGEGTALNTTPTWSSSAHSVATVSASGLVTAVGVGSTTVVAQAGSASGSATIVVRQVPASLTKVAGDQQAGTVGHPLAEPLVIEVRDQGSMAVPSAELTWIVTAGEGSLQSSSVETAANGRGQTTWHLGSAAGEHSVQVSAGSLSPVTFSATAELPDVAAVELLPAADTVTAIGDTARFTATAYADDGTAIPGAAYTYTVTDAAVATISTSGLVTAAGAGNTQVIAQSGGKADTAMFVVVLPTSGSVTVTSVEPTTMVEGHSATIRGTGFSSVASGNVVTVDGLTASVLAATATEIQITVPLAVCKPPRQTVVNVQVDAETGSLSTGITPETVFNLEVGGVVYGSQCLHLNQTTGGHRYVIGLSSLSETPSSLTPAVLSVETGTHAALAASIESGRMAFELDPLALAWAAPSATAPLPADPSEDLLTRHRLAESEWRATERSILVPLLGEVRSDLNTPSLSQSALSAQAALAAAGDTITLNIPPSDGSCSTVTPLTAVVRYVGTSTVWVEDIGNPVESFTADEYASLDQDFSANAQATLADYFGSAKDIDANARTIVFLTKEVNRRGGLLGFVNSGDLFPTTYCSRSNEAEIYYGIVPDPDGVVGSAISKAVVLDLTPSLMVHEITHIIQFTKIIFDGAELKTTWELEGGATLAEQLVGFNIFGHQPGQDLGYDAWYAGGRWYYAWVADMAYYFGYSPSGHLEFAPEQCSWMGREAEGNTGPCENGRAVYGVPATLLRLVLDNWGLDYPGGEAALMRWLTGSDAKGLDNLAAGTGAAREWIHTLFAATLWVDGRYFNSLTSWNIYDIFSRLNPSAQLVPYTDSGTAPGLSVSVRAGSTAYLEWTPPSDHLPTSLLITTPTGTTLPSTMHLWVLRVQ